MVSTYCPDSQISNWLALTQKTGELNTELLLMLLAQCVPSISREQNGTKALSINQAHLENKSSLDVARIKNLIETSRKTWNLTGSTSDGGLTKSASSTAAKMTPNHATVLSERVTRHTHYFHKQSLLPTALSLRSSNRSNLPKT